MYMHVPSAYTHVWHMHVHVLQVALEVATRHMHVHVLQVATVEAANLGQHLCTSYLCTCSTGGHARGSQSGPQERIGGGAGGAGEVGAGEEGDEISCEISQRLEPLHVHSPVCWHACNANSMHRMRQQGALNSHFNECTAEGCIELALQ